MESKFWLYITNNPTQILTWLIFGTGIFLSILHRRKDPKKSVLTLLAFIFLLLDSVGSILAMLGLPFDSRELQEQFYFTFRWVESVLWFGAWTALFFAIFRQESVPNKTT